MIGKIDATILIGLSTVGGAFSETIVREMARKVERPIIFPLSNPTTKSEAKADDLIRWTDGRALVATGSPSPPVSYGGRTHSDRAMQQRLHLSRDGTGSGRVRRPPGHGADDAGGGSSAGRKFACSERPFRVAASSPDRDQAGGRGDRGRGWNRSTKERGCSRDERGRTASAGAENAVDACLLRVRFEDR